MSSLSKHNDSKNINWGVNTEGWKFVKCIDLDEGKKYAFKGCFVTQDKKGYGEGAVIISDGFLVNCPAYFVDTIKKIVEDPESIEDIKNGLAEFSFVKQKAERFGTYYAKITLF